MRLENRYFDITPRIVPADRVSVIVITPRFEHAYFDQTCRYEIMYAPTEEYAESSGWKPEKRQEATIKNGALHFSILFENEQEHVLLIESVSGDIRRTVGDFRIYSLKPDLYERRPWKGDIHMHSTRSDGAVAPSYVPGACRRIGLDFMALTDHMRYTPSIEARDAYDGVSLDLRIYPGEEIHPPNNPVHIVNFGGQFSVNEVHVNQYDKYMHEVDALKEKTGILPVGVDPYQYASTVWCMEKVREGNGLAVFCHPYWFTRHRYTPSGALTSHIFKTRPFCAYEAVGGFHAHELESNLLQTARYSEERMQQGDIPVVGVSDAHSYDDGELFGWYYTIVFSPTVELDDLITSIRAGYSVAIESPPGYVPRPHGPFRLVKYALFLIREIFPSHDLLCAEEGRLMLEYVAGEKETVQDLERLKGRCSVLMERNFEEKHCT